MTKHRMQTTPGLSTFEEIDRKCEVSRTARFALVRTSTYRATATATRRTCDVAPA